MLVAPSEFSDEVPTRSQQRCFDPSRMGKRALVSLIGLGILIVLTGCGDANPLGRKAISGKVTLDGTPLESGSILFEPLADEGVGSGAVITGGTFSIPAAKGLPPGEYSVRMYASGEGSVPAPDSEDGPGAIAPAPPELIPPGWNTRSEQTITVTEDGENQFTFPVKTNAG